MCIRDRSKEERLRRIEQIHTDPPTMYFINREMLTQTSNPTVVLVHGDEPRPADLKGLAPQGLDAKPVSYTHLDVYKRQIRTNVEATVDFPDDWDDALQEDMDTRDRMKDVADRWDDISDRWSEIEDLLDS